LINIALLPKH